MPGYSDKFSCPGGGHFRRPYLLGTCALLFTCKSKDFTTRITSKGQVTIPADIREQAGLLPNTDVEFLCDGEVVRIVRSDTVKTQGRGARIVSHLRARRGDIPMTTDEIMALTRDE